MSNSKICTAGHTAALAHACNLLIQTGYSISASPKDDTTHLLLPVPSFESDGRIKGGGELAELLRQLPQNITVIGGNLDSPALRGYQVSDLLKDPTYVAENANITAHCAIKLAMNKLQATLDGCSVLVIGWGRIGKCLAQLLRGLDADVTVAARKETDRAMLTALNYKTVDTGKITPEHYRVIFNTVPQMILPECNCSALKIDLASKLGIGGDDVIWARGLPNKDAPESSGALIAQTVIRLLANQP